MELEQALAAIDKLEETPKAQAKGLIDAGYPVGMALLCVTSSVLTPENAAKMLKGYQPPKPAAGGDNNKNNDDANSPKAMLAKLEAAHKKATERGDMVAAVSLKRQMVAKRALL